MLAILLLVVVGIALGLLLVTLYAACVVSGRCSREEERQATLEKIANKQKARPRACLV